MAAKARDNWKQTGFTNMAGQQSPDFRQPLNTPAPYDAYTPRTTAPTAFVFPSKTCSGYLLLAIPKSAKNAADLTISPDRPIPGVKLGPFGQVARAQLCVSGNNCQTLVPPETSQTGQKPWHFMQILKKGSFNCFTLHNNAAQATRR